MKKIFYISALALLGTTVILVWKFSGSGDALAGSPAATGNASNPQIALSCMDNSITYGNLKLIPVCANPEFISAKRKHCNYIPLKEALESRKVRITEKNMRGGSRDEMAGDDVRPNNFHGTRQAPVDLQANNYDGGGEVNELMIENSSSDTVYIMGGEVIKGGKQDRMVAQDVMIPPNTGPTALSVFCVEHGRWSPRSEQLSSGANSMSFATYYSVSAASVRKQAVVHNSQDQVWREVAKSNAQNNVVTNTDAYTAIENNRDFSSRKDPYLEAFKKLADANPNMIGVIAVSGDRVLACDVFVCHELFSKEFSGLLQSYVMEALTTGGPVKFSDENVVAYFESYFSNGMPDEEAIQANGAVSKTDASGWTHLNMY